MGMTIAKPIQTLEYLKNSGVFPFSTVDEVLYTAKSIDVVIDTMRKYQKIEQIVKSLDDGEINYPQMTYYLREVLEDGNNYI